jgi:hypothetical protein
VISIHYASTLTSMGASGQRFFDDFPTITAFLTGVSRIHRNGDPPKHFAKIF